MGVASRALPLSSTRSIKMRTLNGVALTSLEVLVGGVVIWTLRKQIRRTLFRFIQDGLYDLTWSQLPTRIIFLRHGEAEHNLDSSIFHHDDPNRKADNLSELTPTGRQQAYEAGRRIEELMTRSVTKDQKPEMSVIVSPFERTQQTLYCLQRSLDETHIRCVHVDPRVREQEFGNFQVADDMQTHRQVAGEVGRFYYRRPTGESGADVYDRASTFWDSLLRGAFNPMATFNTDHSHVDALLVVTHGLTMRLLLMRYFQWSPQTFDAVYNPGNCDMWVLVKDEKKRRYRLEPTECSPPRMPWATRQIRLVMRPEGMAAAPTLVPYTLVDYLTLPQPRTSHPEAVLKQLIPGHGHRLDPREANNPEERARFIDDVMAKIVDVDQDEVRSIDWWCGKISDDGAGLRIRSNRTNRRASLEVLPQGRIARIVRQLSPRSPALRGGSFAPPQEEVDDEDSITKEVDDM